MQCILFADAVYFILSHYFIISHYFNQKNQFFIYCVFQNPSSSLEHKSALGALSKKSEMLSF